MHPKARSAVFLITASVAAFTGCAGPGRPTAYYPSSLERPPAPGEKYTEVGTASWYGDDFHGKTTSNGEIYDMYARTAAHQTLPFGTLVRVTNLENGRCTQARINDRGPFAKGRIIDLSYTLAKEIGMTGTGTAQVRLEALGISAEYPTDMRFALQVGAFEVSDNARNLAKSLRQRFPLVRVVEAKVDGRVFHRVRVGLYASRDDSGGDMTGLQRMQLRPMVVPVD
jgi:rare lipoprotein A